MLGNFSRRFVAGFAGLAVAVGTFGLAAPSASAAEVDLGDLIVSPTTGPSTSYLNLTTPEPCPTGTANFKVSLNGPGITSTADNNLNGVTSYSVATPAPSGPGVTVEAVNTLKDLFQANGVTAPAGKYVINFRCQNSNGGTIFGDFLATINVVASATAFEGTYTYVPPTSAGVATTTTLAATPASPVKAGTTTTLRATVSASTATGTVQFKDGAANLGAPVAVTNGVATKAAVALAAGSHSLSAVFTSSNTGAFLSSTSAATTFVVAGVPVVTGTSQVGKVVGCSTSAGATQTVLWLVNGAATSVTAKTVTVPAVWASKSIACRVTFKQGANSAVQTSAAKKVALGAKLVAKVKPKVSGTPKVGKVLTCTKGTWTPAATSYKYQWLRGTKVISSKVKYKAVKADKGKKVTCKVTAVRPGYVSGLAAATARKVS